MTNSTIIKYINILKKYENKRLPQKINYAIIKNLVILQKEYEIYEKQLMNIFKKYKEDGKLITDKDGNITFKEDGLPLTKDEFGDSFYEDIQELLRSEADVFSKRISENLFDYDNEKFDVLTVKEMAELMSIICENEK